MQDNTQLSGKPLILSLLSSSIELAYLAGKVIREVQQSGTLNITLKDAGDTRSYLTTADIRAQKVIVDGMRAAFPSIKLVGEEDEEDEDETDSSTWYPSLTALDILPTPVSVTPDSLPASFNHITLAELVVFVDPIDGTREYVENRLEAVQSLIGISWRGRAIVGVIGLPFHEGNKVIHGITGVGVFPPFPPLSPTIGVTIAASKVITHPLLISITSLIAPTNKIVSGGCGNKILQLLNGSANVCLFNLESSLWDTCATEAVLVAAGGKMTTFLGTPIEHNVGVPTPNRLGVVATALSYTKSHEELIKSINLNCNMELAALVGGIISSSPSQALDVARNLQGQPFTISEINSFMNRSDITSFSCPNTSTIRYKQSVAARIKLQPSGSFFYKRAVLRELPYAIEKSRTFPFKINRDVRSNIVEHEFLSSERAREFSDNTPRIQFALPYKCESRAYVDRNPIDSRFSMALFDFSPERGWRQHPHFPLTEMETTLKCLAAFHNFFRTDKNNMGWAVACYWHLGQQPEGQLEKLEANWTRVENEFGFPDWNLGLRVRNVAVEASEFVHGLELGDNKLWENEKHTTLIHGDPKVSERHYFA